MFVYEMSDQSVRQITRGDYNHVNPAWSPDGSTIAYVTDRSAHRHDSVSYGEIWKVLVDGGRPQRVTGCFTVSQRHRSHPTAAGLSLRASRISVTGRAANHIFWSSTPAGGFPGDRASL